MRYVIPTAFQLLYFSLKIVVFGEGGGGRTKKFYKITINM